MEKLLQAVVERKPPSASVIKAVPHTQSVIQVGCNVSPCLVCFLHAAILESLAGDPRLAKGFVRKRNAEALATWEQTKKAHPKAAKPKPQGVEGPVADEIATGALELNIVGLRRSHTLSNAFDDRMVVFFRMPTESQGQAVSEVLASLGQALQVAVSEAKKRTRVVTCSGGTWVVAMFPITTDPGAAKVPYKLERLKQKQTANDDRIANLTKELEQRKVSKEEAEARLQAAQKGHQRFRAEKAAASAATDAWKHTGAVLKKAEKARQSLATQRTTLETSAAGKEAVLVKDDSGKLVPYEMNMGMMLPGFYKDQYQYFIHHASSPKLLYPLGSHVALTIGMIPGTRLCNGRYIRKNWQQGFRGRTFDGLRVAELLAPFPIGRRFLDADAVLKVDPSKEPISVVLQVAEKGGPPAKEIPVEDDYVLLAEDLVGGTNLHRAHYIRLDEHGKRVQVTHGSNVFNWSEGCQTFPYMEDFNLFLVLAAIARRVKCHQKSGGERSETTGCALLSAKTESDLALGKAALTKRLKPAVLGPASILYAKDHGGQTVKNPQEVARDRQNVEKLDAARKAKDKDALAAAEAAILDVFLTLKVQNCAADHLRLCDLDSPPTHAKPQSSEPPPCPQRLSYTLVELTSEDLDEVIAAFEQSQEPEWDGSMPGVTGPAAT